LSGERNSQKWEEKRHRHKEGKICITNEEEMREEVRENLKIFFWILKWGIFWILVLLIFGVPFF